MLLLELGVGMNTHGIIKYPFWQMAAQNPNADYVSINAGEAYGTGRNQGEGDLCEWGYWGGYLPMSLTLLYGMGII